MAAIGSLVVDLIAKTAAFNSNIEKAARNLNSNAVRMNRSLDSIEKKARAVGTGIRTLAGAVAVGEIFRVAKAGLEHASSLGEVSQQLGVTTRDLQVYRYAASQAGIEQEIMDKGLAKLSRTIGEAALGQEKQVKLFEGLGIEVRNAAGEVKTAGEVMPELAEQISKIESPAERAAVLAAALGKSGQKMASLLEGGASGVMDFADAAERLGLVISDDKIAKADKAADDLAALKAVLEVNIASAVAANAGALTSFAQAIGRVGEAMANINPTQWKLILGGAAAGAVAGFISPIPGGTILGAIGGGAAVGLAADAGNRAGAKTRVNRLPLRPGATSSDGLRFDEKTGKFVSTIKRPGPALGDPDPEEIFDKSGGGAKKAAKEVDHFARIMERMREQSSAGALELRALNENWPDSQLAAAQARLDAYNDLTAEGVKLNASQTAALESQVTALGAQEQALILAAGRAEVAEQAIMELVEAQEALRDAANDNLAGSLEDMLEIPDLDFEIPESAFQEIRDLQDLAGGIGEAFGSAAEDVLLGFRSIEDAARALVADLAAMFLRQFVTKPLMGFISGLASSAFGVPAPTGFDVGGYTGNIDEDKVAGVVHGREFVINAAATRRHRPLLEAINEGRRVPGYKRGGFVGIDRAVGAVANDVAAAGGAGAGGGITLNGDIVLQGPMTPVEARRTGRQVMAGMMEEGAEARRRGIAG